MLIRFNERTPHESASRELHDRSATSQTTGIRHPKIPIVFNGERWSERYNRPEIRIVCIIGPPQDVPVHWDPTYRRKCRDGKERLGRLVICPRGGTCRFCKPTDGRPPELPRFDLYIPACYCLPSRAITKASKRCVWHVPQWTADDLITGMDNAIGEQFEVSHGPNGDPEEAGELIIEPIGKKAPSWPSSFNPQPSVFRVFGLPIPPELLESLEPKRDAVTSLAAGVIPPAPEPTPPPTFVPPPPAPIAPKHSPMPEELAKSKAIFDAVFAARAAKKGGA